MKAIEKNDLYEYKFLSSVKAAPTAERIAFTVSTCDKEQNAYSSSIWLYENGKTKKLTGMDKEQSFFWEDDTHILFPAIRTEADKKRIREGEKFSCFYRLDINGGEAQKAFEIPTACGELYPLNGELKYFIGSVDSRYPDFYKMSKKKQSDVKAELAKDNDYHVLTANPWWFNGEGFIDNNVSTLFTYNIKTGELLRVSESAVNVGNAATMNGKIYYSAKKCTSKPNNISELYCYDPKTNKTECLDKGELISDFFFLDVMDGKLFCIVSLTKPTHGLNTNCSFFYFNTETKKYEHISTPDLAIASSVGSDVRYGGGQFCKIYNDELYIINTVRNSAILQKMNKDGVFTPICTKEGSLDCIDITNSGKIYGAALYDMKPGELYDISEKPKQLTHFNQKAVSGKYIAQPQMINIESCGCDIDGWVLYPKDYDSKKAYPAVFDIHGGPKTVYGEVFYHEMQVWASKGWFVFFCNPIGSDGRGNEFMDIRGKYGTVDYQNLMDFTDAVLAKYPQIDKSRVGVTGGSYGGFMTNWIIGHTDRFACAATQRSITNWISFYGVSDIGIDFTENEQATNLLESPEKLWEHSPLKYVKNIKTPTLFIHSDEDYRCPISEGLQLYTALIDLGVETRFVWFKGENHDLSRSGKPLHRMRRLAEITDWLEKHIG